MVRVQKVAALIIFARVIDLFWLIGPETHREGLVISWMDVLLPAAMLALWSGLYMQQLRQRPVLPLHDPQFEEAVGALLAAPGQNPRTAH